MKKLTKYNDFKTLKSNNPASSKDEKAASEFDTFLKLLQKEYSNKKKTRATNGKQS